VPVRWGRCDRHTVNFVGAIVEPGPPVWRKLPHWYLGTYRRLKDYADNENSPDSEVEVPRPKVVDFFVSFLGFAAIVVVGALANNWNPWLWLGFPAVVALGASLFWQVIRMPGGG
jgi:hypothetical protein